MALLETQTCYVCGWKWSGPRWNSVGCPKCAEKLKAKETVEKLEKLSEFTQIDQRSLK